MTEEEIADGDKFRRVACYALIAAGALGGLAGFGFIGTATATACGVSGGLVAVFVVLGCILIWG